MKCPDFPCDFEYTVVWSADRCCHTFDNFDDAYKHYQLLVSRHFVRVCMFVRMKPVKLFSKNEVVLSER